MSSGNPLEFAFAGSSSASSGGYLGALSGSNQNFDFSRGIKTRDIALVAVVTVAAVYLLRKM